MKTCANCIEARPTRRYRVKTSFGNLREVELCQACKPIGPNDDRPGAPPAVNFPWNDEWKFTAAMARTERLPTLDELESGHVR
jgi:hypothetical protein